jgi:hypothetical protein
MDPAVRTQNLNPDVLMMDPAKDWYRCDADQVLKRHNELMTGTNSKGSSVVLAFGIFS